MKTKRFKVGGAGATADDEIYANVLRNMFHLPLRVVSGYPGRAETVLSIQRGEIDGLCGWTWASLMSRGKYLLDSKQLAVVLHLVVEKNLNLPRVPLVGELNDDHEDNTTLNMSFSRRTFAHPYAT